MKNFKWVLIASSENQDTYTYMAEVPGGWIIRTVCFGDIGISQSMVFVPKRKAEGK